MMSESLLDRMSSPEARSRVLELATLFYATLAPRELDGAELWLSPPAALLLDLIDVNPMAARVDLGAHAAMTLAVCDEPIANDVIALAHEVMALRLVDVAALGTAADVIALLSSVQRDDDRRRMQRRKAA